MLGVDAGRDDVLHHVEDAAAGVEQEGLARVVDRLDDRLVLGDHQLPDLVRGQQGGGLEAQIVAEAADAVDVAVLLEEPLPDFQVALADLEEHVVVQLFIVHPHVAQILVAHQILHALEDAVPHAADGLHALRHVAAQRLKGPVVHLEVGVADAVPGVALKVLPGLDDALHMLAQGTAARHGGADELLEGDRVVAHIPVEAAVVAEELVQIPVVPVVQLGEGHAGDLLHHLGVHLVLVEGKPLDLDVPGGLYHIGVIRLKLSHGYVTPYSSQAV